MQNLIFVEAYDEIETSLYLATTLKDVSVAVVNNDNLAQFFTALGDKLPVQLIRLKTKKDKYLLKDIKQKDIYFLTRYVNPLTLYFVQQLSRHNSIKYMHYGYLPDNVSPYRPQNLREWISLIHLKMLFGRYVTFGQMLWMNKFALLSAGFFNKKVSVNIDFDTRNRMMKDFNTDLAGGIWDAGKYEIMYFDQPIENPAYGYISDIDKYRKEIGAIAQAVKESAPPGTCILRKYRSDKDVRAFSAGDDAPNFLPPISLYHKNVKLYLGVYSSALYNTRGGTVVSLMDLVTFKDAKTKQNMKEYLLSRSKNKILFPASLDELKSVVKSLYV